MNLARADSPWPQARPKRRHIALFLLGSLLAGPSEPAEVNSKLDADFVPPDWLATTAVPFPDDQPAYDRCVQACNEAGYHAIELIFEGGFMRIQVIKDKCNGCGWCEHHCPVITNARKGKQEAAITVVGERG